MKKTISILSDIDKILSEKFGFICGIWKPNKTRFEVVFLVFFGVLFGGFLGWVFNANPASANIF